MKVPGPADGFVVRLDELLPRLAQLAETPPPGSLTDRDPDTGERWDWGQVWAHMVEFVPYWVGQLQVVLEAEGDQPVPFGRVQSDPDRIRGVEEGRRRPVPELWTQLSEEIGELKAFLASLTDDDWRRRGAHQTLGVMSMERMVDRFLTGHLDQHVDQLAGLAGHPSSPGAPTG